MSVLPNDFATDEEFEFADDSHASISGLLRRFDGLAIDNMLFEVHVEADALQIGLSDGRNGWASLFVADHGRAAGDRGRPVRLLGGPDDRGR